MAATTTTAVHVEYSQNVRNLVSRAIVNGDIEYLRMALVRMGMFAMHTANNTTDRAEYEYLLWAESGYSASWAPRTLPNRWRNGYATLSAFASTLTIDWFMQDKWEMVLTLARAVNGLSCVKASFTLGLLGYDLACLDTHALVELAGMSHPERHRFNAQTNVKGKSETAARKSLALYRTMHDRLFPVNPRDTQWDTFAQTVQTFRETGHFCAFRAVGAAH